MTDIEFDQIREGQTVRLHLDYGRFSVTGVVTGTVTKVADVEIVLGTDGRGRFYPTEHITRVELLSEPAPKWEQDRLAELTGTTDDGDRFEGIASWSNEDDGGAAGWVPLSGGLIVPGSVIGEPRLLKAVPADAVVVAHGAPVLPPLNPATGQKWSHGYMRDWARHYAEGSHLNVLLSALADAVEEAQR